MLSKKRLCWKWSDQLLMKGQDEDYRDIEKAFINRCVLTSPISIYLLRGESTIIRRLLQNGAGPPRRPDRCYT